MLFRLKKKQNLFLSLKEDWDQYKKTLCFKVSFSGKGNQEFEFPSKSWLNILMLEAEYLVSYENMRKVRVGSSGVFWLKIRRGLEWFLRLKFVPYPLEHSSTCRFGSTFFPKMHSQICFVSKRLSYQHKYTNRYLWANRDGPQKCKLKFRSYLL